MAPIREGVHAVGEHTVTVRRDVGLHVFAAMFAEMRRAAHECTAATKTGVIIHED